jgi:hypothetical protein
MTNRRMPQYLIGLLLTTSGLIPVVCEPLPEEKREELAEQILNESEDIETRVAGIYRVRLSYPQRLSAGIGGLVVRQPANYDCIAVCDFRGFMFQFEPGIAGGQFNAGYAIVFGEKGHNKRFLSRVHTAYGVSVAYLRTWGNSGLDPPDQNRLGIEGDFTVIGVNFSVGVFRHVGSGEPSHPWLISGGIGWGF